MRHADHKGIPITCILPVLVVQVNHGCGDELARSRRDVVNITATVTPSYQEDSDIYDDNDESR